MPSSTPDPKPTWLVLSCPGCAARCRVRSAARSAARCPACGTLLDPAPKRAAPARSAREPEDDEECNRSYEVAVTQRPTKPPPPVAPEEELEEEPERPRPPAYPLWQGVYGFPWYVAQLRAWFLFGLGFTCVALLGAAVHHVIQLHQSTSEVGQGIYFRVIILFVKALIVAFLWTGTFAAPYFLAVIRETAAGNDEFAGPDNSLGEKLFEFIYLCWIAFCSIAPLAVAGIALERLTRMPGLRYEPLLLFVLVFPQFLLGSLVNDSWLMLLSGHVALGLLKRPGVMLISCLASVLVLAPGVVLGVLTILGLQYFLAPLTGFVWSAGILIYGRLLGRVGWILTHGDESLGRSRRRRKKRKGARTGKERPS